MKKQPNKTKSDAKPKAEPRENTRENRETEKQSTDKLAIIWRSARRPISVVAFGILLYELLEHFPAVMKSVKGFFALPSAVCGRGALRCAELRPCGAHRPLLQRRTYLQGNS